MTVILHSRYDNINNPEAKRKFTCLESRDVTVLLQSRHNNIKNPEAEKAGGADFLRDRISAQLATAKNRAPTDTKN